MANTKLVFLGTSGEMELVCFVSIYNEICINIIDTSVSHNYNSECIAMDKETAIKLHRELKKQISFLEKEVSNG